jgi:hypothetical protein
MVGNNTFGQAPAQAFERKFAVQCAKRRRDRQGLSLTLSMAWHCAQSTRTKVRPSLRCRRLGQDRTAGQDKAPSAINSQRCPAGYVGTILLILRARWRRGLKRLEIRHKIRDLSRRKLEHRHFRMDAFSQGPLQVLNGIFEMQGTEWRRVLERTFAKSLDGMALRAM